VVQSRIDIIKVSNGIFWVNIHPLNLRILCGCPADTVKHLKKRGLVDVVQQNGVQFETGPNAILLADIALQNGALSNLAEFPLLQMLYSQGMLLPNHPNNNGQKPLLIGSAPQIKAQMEYFYRGNYGLISKEEIMAAGASEALADEIMHVKLRFAFGELKPSDKLVDKLVVEDELIEIKEGAFIRRKDINIFEISYEGESVTVDLNLRPKEFYEPPYYLGYHKLNREYFSIVHTGEGDAWDVNRPCMASLVTFQGKIYLVDAGPDLLTSLNAMGVSINEVAGIFNTHAHDDHFAGLISFVRSDHRIKYFASPIVRASVSKKLCALMGLGEENFERFFEVEDLKLDQWNNINGLEVKPVLSPHPVETNIFYFRTFWGNRYLTYGHLADVASFRVLEQNIYKNTETQNFDHLLLKVKNDYLYPTDLKKIDIGGGLIHGDAKDFDGDKSSKILLAHISRGLTDSERQIGSFAPFGSIDSLADTNHDFLRASAYDYLKFYFPNVPEYEIHSLLNCPMVSMTAGENLFKKDATYKHVYLVLTGSVELVYPETGIENNLSAGSLVGYFIDDNDLIAKATCQATSYITALKIPLVMYLNFVKRHHLVEDFNKLEHIVSVLSTTWAFSENISLPIYIKLAQLVNQHKYDKGANLSISQSSGFNLILSGKAALLTSDGGVVENLKKGDFFGAENILPSENEEVLEIFFLEDTELYHIPIEVVMNIPIVYWKIHHTAEKRSEMMI
jgi:hemerythrin